MNFYKILERVKTNKRLKKKRKHLQTILHKLVITKTKIYLVWCDC